jgi:Ca2+-binding RTX toxin-like protein
MLARSLALSLMAVSSSALAAPTISACTNSEHPLGWTATCPTGLCTFDSGTGLVSCDQSSQTTVTKGFLVSSGADFVYFGTDIGGERCCKIDDPSSDVDGFRVRGGSADDFLGFRFCDGSLGALYDLSEPSCTGTNHHLNTTNSRPLTAEILGGGGADLIVGTSNGNVSEILRGNGGADLIAGGGGSDIMYGGDNPAGAGNRDRMQGGSGNDVIYGEDGDDECYGGHGDDTLYGGPGDDFKLTGHDGDDLIFGGTGNDTLDGYEGNDRLFGEDGLDHLHGNAGSDTLCDGGDFDYLEGGLGDDFLWFDDTGGDSPAIGSSPDGITAIPPGTNDVFSASISSIECEAFLSVLPIPSQCLP